MTAVKTLISATVLALTLTACGGGDEEEASAPSTEDTESCAPSEEGSEFVDFSTTDDSVRVVGDTTDSISGPLYSLAAVSCVVDKLGGPASIAERVGATNSVSGNQSEEWDGFEANWSYSSSSNQLLFTVDAK